MLTILSVLLISGLIAGLVTLSCFLRDLRLSLQKTIASLEKQSPQPLLYTDLTNQVGEIRQAMGGVVNSLHTMGSQVEHLNQLAGYALENAQVIESDVSGDQSGSPTNNMPIMIEIHRSQENTDDGEALSASVDPESLSPEMMDRFRIFRAVYEAIVRKKNLPSRRRPELN